MKFHENTSGGSCNVSWEQTDGKMDRSHVANSPLSLLCQVPKGNRKFSVELDKYNPRVKSEPFDVTAVNKTLHTDMPFYDGFSEI
jgi:hypothetical protein